MNKIFLIGGSPTAGKSYYTRILAEELKLPWISTDTIREQMREIVNKKDYPNLYKELREIGAIPEAGDTTVKWNANNPDEVKMARKAFKAAIKEYGKDAIIFAVNKKGKKDQKIVDFDPLAEEILVQPRPHPGPDPGSENAYGSELNMSELL